MFYRHLVPLANLKPVNPVPAWNVVTSRKGDLGTIEYYNIIIKYYTIM